MKGNMEDEKSYYCLSRKELQDLCKKNGLPARKTNIHMAKSLASYYQNKNVSMFMSDERSVGSQGVLPLTSPVSNLEPESESIPHTGMHESQVEAVDRNRLGHSSCCKEVSASTVNAVVGNPSIDRTVEDSEHSNSDPLRTTECLILGSKCHGNSSKFEKKETLKSIFNEDLQLPDGNCGPGDTSQAHSRNIGTSNGAKTRAPTCQFYVRSDEGINICVDLNSSLSDWFTSMKTEVCTHPEELSNKPWALNHDVRNLGNMDEKKMETSIPHEIRSLGNSNEQTRTSLPNDTVIDCQTKSESSLCSAVKESNQDGGDESLRFSTAITCSAPNSQVHSVQNPTNLDAMQNIETLNLRLDARCSSSQIKSAVHDVWNLKSVARTCPKTLSVGTSSVSSDRELLHSDEVLKKTPTVPSVNDNVARPGSFTSGGSTEMQVSQVSNQCEDVLHCPYENGGKTDLDSPVHNFQIDNSESASFDLNICQEPSSISLHNQQRSNLGNGMESSNCLQIENSINISEMSPCSKSEGPESKRQCIHSEDDNSTNTLAVKNLRSAKKGARGACPRRSARFISKFISAMENEQTNGLNSNYSLSLNWEKHFVVAANTDEEKKYRLKKEAGGQLIIILHFYTVQGKQKFIPFDQFCLDAYISRTLTPNPRIKTFGPHKLA